MVTRRELSLQISSHLEGELPLEDLAAWAEAVFRMEVFEPGFEDCIAEVLSSIRDAVDPHRFRWEEPDFDGMLERLAD